MNAYEEIELRGLLGDDALESLEITNPDREATDAIETCFDALADTFDGTLIAALDVEPLLWGFANLLHRRRMALERQRDEIGATIKRLITGFDGSEIGDVEMQEAQRAYERTEEREVAFTLMLETAMARYESDTGKPWFPRSGSVANRTATAAMIDGKAFLAAAKQREVEAKAPDGQRIIIAGGPDYEDQKIIWSALDRTRDRLGDVVLLHGGMKRGVDHIAALWARQRGVPQAAFQPDFGAHRKAAPFRRNDEMLDANPKAVILFPGNGISENIGQKAEAKGVPVWRPVKTTEGAA